MKIHVLYLAISLFLFGVSSTNAQSIEKNKIGFAGGNLTTDNLGITLSLGETLVGFSEAEDASIYLSNGFLLSLAIETLQVNDFVSENWGVYPNPFSNSFQLVAPSSHYTVKIYNLQGRLVFEETQNPLHRFTANQLKNGVYLLQIEDQINNKKVQQKIIKQ